MKKTNELSLEQLAAIDALVALRNELRDWAATVSRQAASDLERGRAVGLGDAAVLINDEIRLRTGKR